MVVACLTARAIYSAKGQFRITTPLPSQEHRLWCSRKLTPSFCRRKKRKKRNVPIMNTNIRNGCWSKEITFMHRNDPKSVSRRRFLAQALDASVSPVWLIRNDIRNGTVMVFSPSLKSLSWQPRLICSRTSLCVPFIKGTHLAHSIRQFQSVQLISPGRDCSSVRWCYFRYRCLNLQAVKHVFSCFSSHRQCILTQRFEHFPSICRAW